MNYYYMIALYDSGNKMPKSGRYEAGCIKSVKPYTYLVDKI